MAGAIAAVAIVALIIALTSSGGDLRPALPTTSTPAETIVADPTQPPLPEPLADTFADLERAIQE